MKQDLTNYSDDELSLQVFNDEFLYNNRENSRLINLLDEMFIYDDKQLEVLQDDIADDLQSIS